MSGFSALPVRPRLIYLSNLLGELVARDMKLRYKRSVLGIAWSLLNPLAQLLVFSFIFRLVLPVNVPRYSSFVFSGLLSWNWFQSSLLFATGAIVGNRDLIKWPGFPAAILPAVRVTSDLIHFLLALPVLLLFLMVDGVQVTSAIVALPFVIGVQFALTLGLAYLISTSHVTFRDTHYLLGVFMQLLFFLTPVFYDGGAIPPGYRSLYRLNPMVHLIEAYRAILIWGEMPNRPSLLLLALLAAGLLFLGYTVFSRASFHFAEEL